MESLRYVFKGDHYEDGQQYIELTDGNEVLYLHVNTVLSKQEKPRFLAMVANTFTGVELEVLYEVLQQYTINLYKQQGLSYMQVIKRNIHGRGYDALAVADYLFRILEKKRKQIENIPKRRDQLLTVGITRLCQSNFTFDYDAPNIDNLYWIKGVYLTKLLGLTDTHTKIDTIRELYRLGLVVQHRNGAYDVQITIGDDKARGTFLDYDFRHKTTYYALRRAVKDRHQRKVAHDKDEVLTKIHRMNRSLVGLPYEHIPYALHI